MLTLTPKLWFKWNSVVNDCFIPICIQTIILTLFNHHREIISLDNIQCIICITHIIYHLGRLIDDQTNLFTFYAYKYTIHNQKKIDSACFGICTNVCGFSVVVLIASNYTRTFHTHSLCE